MDKTLVHTRAYFESSGIFALCSADLFVVAHVSAVKGRIVSAATNPGLV